MSGSLYGVEASGPKPRSNRPPPDIGGRADDNRPGLRSPFPGRKITGEGGDFGPRPTEG